MVLHFVTDEKVTDQIIENFERLNKTCYFLVFLDDDQKSYQFIKSKSSKIIDFNLEKNDIMEFVDKYNPEAILLHSLQLDFAKAILDINKEITIAWYPWGFDIYGLPKIKPKTYARLTNNFLLKANPKLFWSRKVLKHSKLRKLYFRLNSAEENRYHIIFRAIKKIKYFASYIEEDFQIFSKAYPNSLHYIYSPFSTLSQYLAGNDEIELNDKAQHIIIGNSNTPESNHLDVFEKIAPTIDKEVVKVYVPLSYGGEVNYRNAVLTHGKQKLGAAFKPLLDFMNREDYILMLTMCSTGIFYHYRQQAMGNVIAMLFMGARIYMSSKNPAFSFFTKNGIRVFDFDFDFELYKNTKLESNIVINNRKILNSMFNEEKVLKDLETFIKTISQ